MTSSFRNNLMVGIASIVAIALLVFGVAYLGGKVTGGKTITVTAIFKDAQGMMEGSEVRMAGVEVGRISSIALNKDHKAVVKLILDKKIPVPKNSEFVVQGSVLGNTSLMNIVPGNAPAPLQDGDTVYGTAQADLQSVLAKSQEILPTLQKTAESAERTMAAIEKLSTDPAKQRSLDRTLANIDAITTNLNRATQTLPHLQATAETQLLTLSSQSRRLLADLDAAAVSGNRIAKNGEKLTVGLNDTLVENRKTLHSLLESADESASALAGLLNQAGGIINDPDIKRNLVQTTANLESVTARLETTTGNIERLSGDPRLAADLRDTVSNLKDTTESIRNVAGRVETIHIPGERRRPTDPNATPAPPRPAASTSLVEPGLAFDSFYDTTNPRFRADVNYTYRTGNKGVFYRGGLSDLTEGNGINLQLGQEFGRNGNVDLAYRYGLLNGKFGLGFDTRLGPLDFRLDVYDPNRLSGNARLKLYLNRDRTQSLLFGLDDFARENRATIGVQFRP